MSKQIPVAIIGASGYSGQELLRILLQHRNVELVAATSRTEAGLPIAEVFPAFSGIGVADQLCFQKPNVDLLKQQGVEVVFLALPHGISLDYAKECLEAGMTVIDLSADYRLKDPTLYAEFYDKEHPHPHLLAESVYGLVEWHRDKLTQARLIAAPGCYPTSILLPLLPLLKEQLITPETIIINSMSGASGAGKSAKIPLLFCEVAESLRGYGFPKHRHLAEIEEQLSAVAGKQVVVCFQPHLVPVRRGILTTINVALGSNKINETHITEVFQSYFAQEPLIRLRGAGNFPDSKNVVGSPFLDLGWHIDQRTNRLILCSAEDNLSKGAASQAVQCFEEKYQLTSSLHHSS